MAKDPAFLFYSKDFYEGTRTMLPEERACYIDLLIYQHQNEIIPLDLKRVVLYCNGVSEAMLLTTLEAKFIKTDKGWYNEKLKTVINERKLFSEKQSVNGLVGQFWKKSKAILDRKSYSRLKELMLDKTNFEILTSIKNIEITKDMLEAMLKHLEDENENNNLNICLWKTDFEIYKKECNEGYKKFFENEKLLKEQERLNPGINVRLSIEKGYKNFWIKEAGWKHKKASRIKTIDWESTIINSISLNKVYYTKEELAKINQ